MKKNSYNMDNKYKIKIKKAFLSLLANSRSNLYIVKYSDGDIILGHDIFIKGERYYATNMIFIKSVNTIKNNILFQFGSIGFYFRTYLCSSDSNESSYVVKGDAFSSTLCKASYKDVIDAYNQYSDNVDELFNKLNKKLKENRENDEAIKLYTDRFYNYLEQSINNFETSVIDNNYF